MLRVVELSKLIDVEEKERVICYEGESYKWNSSIERIVVDDSKKWKESAFDKVERIWRIQRNHK
jgi:hypothetical protein